MNHRALFENPHSAMGALTWWTVVCSMTPVSAITPCTCPQDHPFCLAHDKKCYAYSSTFSMSDDVSTSCLNCTAHFSSGLYAEHPLNPNGDHESNYACSTDTALYGGVSQGFEQCQTWCTTDARCEYFSIWTSALSWCRLSTSCDAPHDVRPDDEVVRVFKKVRSVIPGSNSWITCSLSDVYDSCDVGSLIGNVLTGDAYCCCENGYEPTPGGADPYCTAIPTTTTTTTTMAEIPGSATWLSCDYDHMSTCFTHCCCDSWYEYNSVSESCVAASTSTTFTTTEPPPDQIPLSVCNFWCVDYSHVCGFGWCCDVGYAYNEAAQNCQQTTTTTTTPDMFVNSAQFGTFFSFGLAAVIGVAHFR